MEKGLKKLSLLTLALGVIVSGIPGLAAAASGTTSASSPLLAKQALSNTSVPAVISSKINTSSAGKVRVIVQLSNQPAATGIAAAKQGISSAAFSPDSLKASVDSQQATVLKKATAKGIDLSVNYQFNTVLNGFEVTVPANEIPYLAKIPGVVSIHENSTWYVMPDETPAYVSSAVYDVTPIHQIEPTGPGFTGIPAKA